MRYLVLTFLLCAVVVFAGPQQMMLNRLPISFGAGPSYSPATDTNVVEWLKADSITGTNGALVPTWIAATGASPSNNAGATEPTLMAAARNGLPAVVFNNSTGTYLSNNSTFGTVNQPMTIVYVAQVQNIAGYNQSIFASCSGSGSFAMNYNTSFELDIYGGSGGGWTDTTLATDGGWHIVMLVYNTTSSKSIQDNGSVNSLSGNVGSGSLQSLDLGANGSLGIGSFTGALGELLIYNGDQTGNASNIIAYLNSRWNVYNYTVPVGLVGYWPTNGSGSTAGTVPDASGNGNVGIPGNGGPTWGTTTINGVSGVPYMAFSTNSSNYIRISDSPSLQLTSAGSVQLWVNLKSGFSGEPVWQTGIMGKGDYCNSQRNCYGFVGSTPAPLQIFTPIGNGTTVEESSTPIIATNYWWLLTLTWTNNGSAVLVYSNTTPNSGSPTTVSAATANYPLNIGADGDSPTSPHAFFNGSIALPTVWNTVLTPAQITNAYNTVTIP